MQSFIVLNEGKTVDEAVLILGETEFNVCNSVSEEINIKNFKSSEITISLKTNGETLEIIKKIEEIVFEPQCILDFKRL